jgi:hypothetical protein
MTAFDPGFVKTFVMLLLARPAACTDAGQTILAAHRSVPSAGRDDPSLRRTCHGNCIGPCLTTANGWLDRAVNRARRSDHKRLVRQTDELR